MPSEFDLISRYFARPTPQAVLGPGDDCALLAPSPGMELAITTDMLVAGTHFFPDTDPYQLGWKTLAVNLSDLAAMGAKPRWVLLAGSLPEANEEWLATFANGLFACAKRYAVDLVGGDTTRGPLNLCLTALGEVPAGKALRRDGAPPGDDLWISGQPGLAALGLAHLQKQIVLPEALQARCITALQRPLPRLELGLALQNGALAHAAIDVSDGLLADGAHIARASGVALGIDVDALPASTALRMQVDDVEARRQLQASGGDDYELCFTAPVQARDALQSAARVARVPVARIGRVAQGQGVVAHDASGAPGMPPRVGYRHFD